MNLLDRIKIVLTRIDPQHGGTHRQQPIPGTGSQAPFWRLPTAQDPGGAVADKPYPHGGAARHPSAYAQGHWRGGVAAWPVGYSPLDYGEVPVRAPKLWKDAISHWDGMRQRGFTQQNYRLQLLHLRPSYPTRGHRSISGVLAGGGPTASIARIPAIFVPSSVS